MCVCVCVCPCLCLWMCVCVCAIILIEIPSVYVLLYSIIQLHIADTALMKANCLISCGKAYDTSIYKLNLNGLDCMMKATSFVKQTTSTTCTCTWTTCTAIKHQSTVHKYIYVTKCQGFCWHNYHPFVTVQDVYPYYQFSAKATS